MHYLNRRAALAVASMAFVIPLGFGVANASAKPATTAGQERAQNRALRADAKSLRTLGGDVKTINGKAGTLTGKVNSLTGKVATLQSGAATLNSTVTTMQSTVSSLQSAFSAATTTVTADLTALQTALTNSLTNTEYGFVQLTAGGTPIPGCFFETDNLPANVNSADLSGTCVVLGSGAAGTLGVNAGVRGVPDAANTSSNGVAEAGISGVAISVSNGAAISTTATCATTPAASGPFTGAPVIAIPTGSPATGTGTNAGFPFSQIATDNVVNLLGSQEACVGPAGAVAVPTIVSGVPGTYSIATSAHFNTANTSGLNPTK